MDEPLLSLEYGFGLSFDLGINFDIIVDLNLLGFFKE